MSNSLVVMIASPLEAEHVETIRAVDPRLEVLYAPELLGEMRYPADHGGALRPRTPDEAAHWDAMLARAEVLFDFDRSHLKDLSQAAPRLKWVQATSAGIGQFVRNQGWDKTSIVFTTASGVHARALADFCLMAMLMFAKDYQWMERDKRARRWERYSGEELTGKTLAIVGLGKVGQEVARHGKKMDMRVIGTKRSPEALSDVDQVFDPSELHRMLPEADVLVLIAPHTGETEGLIGESELALMKPTALFINIARGTLVDEPALIRALQEGRLRGAALDVFATEPLPTDSPLWDMPNVIISPHSASTVLQENARITDLFCDNLRRYLRGEPLRNVLDKERLY
jgi:phosphoglycerate dehydrogenase-like enzyme